MKGSSNGGGKPPAALIEGAEPAEAAGSVDAARNSGAAWLRSRFKNLENGLHLKREDDLIWICAPIRIVAETEDENENFGVLIEWQDRNGRTRQELFPRSLVAGDCREIRGRLADGGLTMDTTTLARQAFTRFLNVERSSERALAVSRTGWHVIAGKLAFVLPDQVFGTTAKPVIYQRAGGHQNPFNVSGSLAGWRNIIAGLAAGNARVVFSIAAAFAGPLLDLAGDEGGGFNLKGASRVGKTTALRVAASVWGGDAKQGAAGFVGSWRATSNGLESVALQFCDTLLCLDEMGQADAGEIGDTAYMLSNGSGKARATRDGGARPPARWRVLFLSTGELGLADKIAEARQTTKAGQEVRMVDIAADAGTGCGLFSHLHDFDSADDLANALRSATRSEFGHAGRAFMAWLVERIEREPEFIDATKARIDAMVAHWLSHIEDAGGQVRSVARRFALVAIAGELATRAGVTGWEQRESSDAARELFTAWLIERGTAGASEDLRAVQQLAAFILRNPARFEVWKPRKDGDALWETTDDAPVEKFQSINRAGWRRFDVKNGIGGWTYFVLPEAMREALAGIDLSSALKVLVAAGILECAKNGKHLSKDHRLPGTKSPPRVYMVTDPSLDAVQARAAE